MTDRLKRATAWSPKASFAVAVISSVLGALTWMYGPAMGAVLLWVAGLLALAVTAVQLHIERTVCEVAGITVAQLDFQMGRVPFRLFAIGASLIGFGAVMLAWVVIEANTIAVTLSAFGFVWLLRLIGWEPRK